MSDHCVIVGAGHGAAQLCASLRRGAWKGPITLIGDEPFLPYHRPPLSKSQLDPNGETDIQLIRPRDFYESNAIDVMTDCRVDAVDPARKQIRIGSRSVSYDKLVLAVGSIHRTPPIAGIDDPRVFTLRTAEDAEAIRNRTRQASQVAIIGAGFIGLEVAASLRKLNIEVSVIELAPRVLSRVTSPEVSAAFEQLHQDHGVHLHTGVSVTEIRSADDGLLVLGPDGFSVPCDFAVLGTGAAANSALAETAGLEVDNGIRVNEYNQTSDPSIYALGDCCNQLHPRYQQHLRLESVQNAVDQAKTVAAALGGAPVAHSALPWFWSDQYDVKLQTAGVSIGYDALIMRGTASAADGFSAWYFKNGSLIAVDAVNDSRAYAVAGKLLQSGKIPDLNVIADVSIDTKEILTRAKDPDHA